MPFSSAPKWSAVQFSHQGTWVLGAPEILVPELPRQVADRITGHTELGQRVLLLAHSDAHLAPEELPPSLACSALVVFDKSLQLDAAGTVRFLLVQSGAVEVLSGDSSVTVGSASPAACAVGRIVLLDSSFAVARSCWSRAGG